MNVSVVIPTKNRKEMLRESLRTILAQSVPVQVQVMDDGSTDGTTEMVRAEFPTVRVQRSETSRGPMVQRNAGAALVDGEFLFTVDDDVTFPSPRTFEQTIALFDRPRVAAVTVPFINVRKQDPRIHTAAPSPSGCYVTDIYYGGMVAFRRAAFLAVGGYRTHYFMHVEEPDLMVRLLNAGYVVRLGTADASHHHESPIRDTTKLNELGPRNYVLYAWYNVPMPYFPLHSLATAALTWKHTLKIGQPVRGLRGVLRGYGASLHEWRKRAPVSRGVYQLSRLLRKRTAVPLEEIESQLPPLPS